MDFLLDHDVPAEISRVLAQAKYNVDKVMDVLSQTASDDKVFNYAIMNELVLITCNRDDFLNLANKKMHHGLIILIRRRTRIGECAALLKLLKKAGVTGITNNINFA